MMDRIILLPGMLSSNFFTNELEYIRKRFDIIGVIAYEEVYGENTKDMIEKYRLPVIQVKGRYIRTIMTKRFWRWLGSGDTRGEVRHIARERKHALKRLAYMFYYGLFCVEACDKIDALLDSIETGGSVYLYSFWLSRNAYAVSYYRRYCDRDNRIEGAVSRAHGYDLYEERNGMGYLPFREAINDGLDAIYFISEDGRHYFQEKYPFSGRGARKLVSRLGTSNKKGIIKVVRPKDEICLVSCSNVIDVKRLDLIIGLVAKLTKNLGGRVHWAHIGDGKLMGEMQLLAQRELPEGSYSFLGKIGNDEILPAYERLDADYFVNLSDSEGVPVSIMEAMSFGSPCIGRRVGGVPEIVDESCGLLIEDIDKEYESVLEFVQMRLEDAEAYAAISSAARRKWEMEYHAERNYEGFFMREIYDYDREQSKIGQPVEKSSKGGGRMARI